MQVTATSLKLCSFEAKSIFTREMETSFFIVLLLEMQGSFYDWFSSSYAPLARGHYRCCLDLGILQTSLFSVILS